MTVGLAEDSHLPSILMVLSRTPAAAAVVAAQIASMVQTMKLKDDPHLFDEPLASKD